MKTSIQRISVAYSALKHLYLTYHERAKFEFPCFTVKIELFRILLLMLTVNKTVNLKQIKWNVCFERTGCEFRTGYK